MTAPSYENRPSSSLLSFLSTSRTSDKYQLLHENINQAFLVVTLPKGKIVDANLKSVKILGHTRLELCKLTLSSLIDYTDLDNLVNTIVETPLGTRTKTCDVPIRIRSGEKKNLRLQCFRSNNNEQLLLIFIYDANGEAPRNAITENDTSRFIALESLTGLMQNPSADNIMLSTPICKSLLDAEEVAIYTAELEPGFGLIATTNSDNVFPPSIAATDDAIGTTLFTWKNGSVTQSIFGRVARKKGYEVVLVQPLGYEASCTGMLVAVFRKGKLIDDATAIRLSIAARILNAILELGGYWKSAVVHTSEIETLEQHWHTLMETTGDGIFSVSTDGNISRVNSLAGTLLGYQLDEIQDMHISDVLVASPPVVGTIQKALEQRETYTSHSVSLIRRDGKEIHVLLRAVPIYDNDRKVAGGLIAIKDNSEHKAMEAKTHHLEQRALLGDLSAIFAHEIRNPLNGITTGLQYLQMQLKSADPLQEPVESILEEATRINRLLQDILLIVKPTELKIEQTSMQDCMEALANRWRERLQRRDISIEVESVSTTPLALADDVQIEQVVTNLISNAMHAMEPDGGAITITVQPSKPQSELRGKHVVINIGDTGPGMSPEVLDRIFDPFFTTRQAGTGLGLAISQRIVNAHRGTIKVQSWPTVGTVFTIVLPAAIQEEKV
ncbi:MAG: hypothetical protein CL789_03440 [Chloroflexi bacterium]|nr:hypothetical protein [Chloroflexota bacterium]HCU80505.1 hypothetical protein [Chloroflexota bacterium]